MTAIDWNSMLSDKSNTPTPYSDTSKNVIPNKSSIDWNSILSDNKITSNHDAGNQKSSSEVGNKSINWDQMLKRKNGDTVMSHDIIAGIESGFTSAFSGSVGTDIASYMPAYLTGRLFGTDPKTGETKFYLSTPEWLGITDNKWGQMTPKERRILISKTSQKKINKNWNPDRSSAAFNISRFGGMLLDPTTALPIFGEGLKAKMGYGAITSGADMVAWSKAQQGDVNWKGVALASTIGAALMGVGSELPTIVKGSSKVIKDAFSSSEVKKASVNLSNFDRVLSDYNKKYDNRTIAYIKARDDLNLNDNTISSWLDKTSTKTKSIDRYSKSTNTLDKLIEPISSRFERINKKIKTDLISMEKDIAEKTHRYMAQSDDFLLKLDGKFRDDNPLAHRMIKSSLLNGEGDLTEKLVKDHLGEAALKDYHVYRDTMKEIDNLSTKYRGSSKNKVIENFTHRSVKDYSLVKKFLGKKELSDIEKIVKRRIKGREPTTEEYNAIYNEYLSGHTKSSSIFQKLNSTKGRKFKKIPTELIDAFHDPASSTHTYIHSTMEDIYKKKFFGSVLNKENKDNLTETIGSFVRKGVVDGSIKESDVGELKTLLELRFSHGLKKPNSLIQKLKDIGYITLIGNPITAVSQLGDLLLGMYKNGIINNFHGISQALTGKGLSVKEMGLVNNLLEEMVSTQSTKKALAFSLKYSLFNTLDALGKNTLLNGSLKKYQKMVMSEAGLKKFSKQWGSSFDKETLSRLVKDLKGKRISDDVKTLIFSELSDMQPISRLEVSEMYLKHPDARILYMLRTFQLKYINLIRRDVIQKFREGKRKEAIKSGIVLMSLYTAGGMATDSIQDLLLGRKINMDDLIVDNILKNTGLINRYTLSKMSTGSHPVTQLGESLLPPVGIFDPFARTIINAAQGKIENHSVSGMVKEIPIFGKIYENFAMGGMERYNTRVENEKWK